MKPASRSRQGGQGLGAPAALRTGLPSLEGLKVGLYGGSFDPPHLGHRRVAEAARRRLGLDLVIWLVSPGNPLKAHRSPGSINERMSRVRTLARGPRSYVSDVEARLGLSYTVDTVRWFSNRYRRTRFVWIMGADSLGTFHLWRGWTDLARGVAIAVVSRPGAAIPSRFSKAARRFASARLPDRAGRALANRPPPAWIYIAAPFCNLSSSALRDSDVARES